MGCKYFRNGMNQELKHQGCKTAEHTHQKGQHEHKILLFDVLFPPLQKAEEQAPRRRIVVYFFFGHKETIMQTVEAGLYPLASEDSADCIKQYFEVDTERNVVDINQIVFETFEHLVYIGGVAIFYHSP